jgi:hypothetical protein
LNAEQRARQHYDDLTADEKIEAVCRMADSGYGDYSIASATGLAVEQIRRILGERASTS